MTALPDVNSSTIENNTTQCDDGFSPSVYWGVSLSVTLSIIIILLFVLGLFSNSSVFFLLAVKRSLRTAPALLLANIALAELIFFVFAVPMSLIAVARGGTWSGSALCQVNGFFTITCAPAIWQGHAIIAGERYVRVVHPLKRIFTKTFSVSLVLLTWVISIAIALIPFSSSRGYFVTKSRVMCGPDFGDYNSPFVVLFFMVLFLPLVVMVMCQAGVYRVARRVRHQGQGKREPCIFLSRREVGDNTAERDNSNKKTSSTSIVSDTSVQTTKTFDLHTQRLKDDIHLTFASFQSSVLYFLIFVLGMIVEVAFHQVQPIHPMSCNLQRSPAFYVSVLHFLLVVADLAINPFIYINRNRPLKKELITRLKCVSRKHSDVGHHIGKV